MFVLTSDGKTIVSTEKELAVAFEEHQAHGDLCFQLHGDDGAYLSAIGEGFGPYTLEWFPSERTGTHSRAAEELKRHEVLEALLDFLRGGSAWRKSRTWHEVEDERPPWPARLMGRISRKPG
jgi:hypothetical protein